MLTVIMICKKQKEHDKDAPFAYFLKVPFNSPG